MTTVKLKLQEAAEFRDPDPTRLPGTVAACARGHTAAAAQLHSRTPSPERQQHGFQPAVMMSEPLVSPASTPTAKLMTDTPQHLFNSPMCQPEMKTVPGQPSPSMFRAQPHGQPNAHMLSNIQLQQATPSGQQGSIAQLSQTGLGRPPGRSGQAATVNNFEQSQLAGLHSSDFRPHRTGLLHSKQSLVAGQSGNPWAHQAVPALKPQTQPVCAWSPAGSGPAPGPPLPSAALDSWAPASLAVSS